MAATAGAPATLDMTVTNTGNADSAPQSLAVSGPAGVSLAGASAAQPAALRRQSALLASATPSGAPASPGQVTCTASPDQCRYTVPAGQTMTIEITLAIAPDAQPGPVSIEINGTRAGTPLNLTVAPALTGLSFGRPPGGWNAGSTVTTDLTAAVAPGVTDPGTVTIGLHNGDLWITGYPGTCTADSAGSVASAVAGAGSAGAITCTPAVSNGTASFGAFAVTLLPSATGIQQVPASLPGGRTAQVAGGDGAAVDATALEPGGPIDLTGPFGGAIVGASAMQCSAPWVTRADCHDGPPYGQNPCNLAVHGNHGDGLCTMQAVAHPQALTAIPGGAQILSATLTWAATTPAQIGTDGPGSAELHVIDHAGDPVADVPVTGSQIHTADAAGTGGGGISIHSADVTATFRSAVVDALRGGGSVWADGIAAGATGSAAGSPSSSPSSSGGSAPMAGWALAVIWSMPGTSAVVELSDPGTYSIPGGATATVDLAAAGPPVSSLTAVFWATDPWGDKRLTLNGEAVPGFAIPGVLDTSIDGAPVQVATGVDVVTATSGGDGSTGGPGDQGTAVLTNSSAAATGLWAPAAGTSEDDGLWIGPTLVTRAVPASSSAGSEAEQPR